MAGMPPGAGQQPGPPGQSPQLQFGPESLMALLMSMFSGGPQAMGPAAGNGMMVGQNSMQSIMPQLLAALQPQQQPQPGMPQPGQPGQPGQAQQGGQARGGAQQSPGGPPGGGGQQMNPQMQGVMQILQMLGLGGGSANRGGSAPVR